MSIQDIAANHNIHVHVGDHVRVKRPVGYCHHMLVVRVMDDTTLQVIHYSGDSEGASRGSVIASSTVASSGSCRAAQVLEGEVDMDPESEKVELLEYSEGVALYTGHNAIYRAREKVGEQDYNLFFNNCESFVNWAITNKTVSGQGQKAAVGTGTAATVVGSAAFLLGLGVAALGIGYALSKKKDNAESDSD